MTDQTTPYEIAHRYRLIQQIGVGGMGEVYHAYDRLTGGAVALKRVRLPTLALGAGSTTQHSMNSQMLRVAITKEFQLAASLRHPNIITILDYGFDANDKPFFTMELLDTPHTLLEAGNHQSDTLKLHLLAQTLQALSYIHRRGIIHRDLKPANILVIGDQVKVVDFGLATLAGELSGGGTLMYQAPETLNATELENGAAGIRSDLYSFGVIAYELFTGHHPYTGDSLTSLIEAIIQHMPDLDDVPEGLRPLLWRLLAKSPDDRPEDSTAVLYELSAIGGADLMVDTVSGRESFLQAARFVGRDSEMARLRDGLARTLAGRGNAFLIGGESGVGKSRLLDELRIHALVEKAVVVRGQAVESGGFAYQLWRDPLRRLLLAVEVSDLEAGVLKPIVPEIAVLLGRSITDAPELSAAAAQERLSLMISTVIKRFGQPLVLLLEDVHWAGESLNAISKLLSVVETLPLCIVATYRDDERADLPTLLPGMQIVKLARLSDQAIIELCASMIGSASQNLQVLDFVRKESEGNTFFIIEVMRALAEEAGRLERIGQQTLPTAVFTGGLQQIVQRRLQRVPVWAHELLNLAAVSGRALNEQLLRPLAKDVSYEQWLTVCAEAVVLECHENVWRFAHDKLRQGVLAALDATTFAALHRQIAKGLETLYPDTMDVAPALADHWFDAGNVDQALSYTLAAAPFLFQLSQYQEVLRLTERTLDALDPADGRHAHLHVFVGDCWRALSDFERARGHYETALAHPAVSDSVQGEALNGLARVAWHQGGYELALQHANRERAIWQRLGDTKGLARTSNLLGIIASRQGRYTDAIACYQDSLALQRMLNSQVGISTALSNLGLIAFRQGEYTLARRNYEDSLAIDRALGDRHGQAVCLNNLGGVAGMMGDSEGARTYFEASLAIRRDIADRYGIAQSLNNLSDVYRQEGRWQEARRLAEEGMALKRVIGDRYGEAQSLYNLGSIALMQEDAGAHTYLEASLHIREEIGDQRGIAESRCGLALCLLGVPPAMPKPAALAAAQAHLNSALNAAQAMNASALITLILIACARWCMINGHAPTAKTVLTTIHQQAPESFEVKLWLARLGFEAMLDSVPTDMSGEGTPDVAAVIALMQALFSISPLAE